VLQKGNNDYRFSKLMLYMQRATTASSSFIELIHAFKFKLSSQLKFFGSGDEQVFNEMEQLLENNEFGFAGSLLHCLCANNHSHLINELAKYLTQLYGTENELRLQSKLRLAANSINSFD
jgi:hypothetical protein